MIPSFLIARFGPAGAKIAFFGGIAALLSLFLLLAYCSGRTDGKTGEVVKQQEREIETQRDLGKANESAAGTRVEATVRAAKQQKELTDALQTTNDPDRRRALRGCVILRQQGRNLEDVPACRGFVTSD